MYYEPGDLDKIIDTVIALDVALGVLFNAISDHDKVLAATLAKTLKDSADMPYDGFPAEMAAGIAGKLREWNALLTNQPTSPGKH